VSTRNHGKVNKDFPSAGQLNGVDVLAIDSNTVYVMDASIKYQSFRTPPLNVLNRQSFLLMPDDMKWVLVDDDRFLLRQNTNILANLTDSGVINGQGINWYYDYAKSFMLDSSDNEDEDRFFNKKTEGLKIISSKRESSDDPAQPLIEKLEFSYQPENTNEFYFVNPQFLLFKKENPFIKDTRNTDIDLGCNQQFTVTFHLIIPSTFQVSEVPKNILVRAPDSSFSFKRIFSYDSGNILMSQTFEIKQSIFDKGDYPAIKEFFSRAYSLMSDEIVLRRRK
jgi:hypothetical protein